MYRRKSARSHSNRRYADRSSHGVVRHREDSRHHQDSTPLKAGDSADTQAHHSAKQPVSHQVSTSLRVGSPKKAAGPGQTLLSVRNDSAQPRESHTRQSGNFDFLKTLEVRMASQHPGTFLILSTGNIFSPLRYEHQVLPVFRSLKAHSIAEVTARILVAFTGLEHLGAKLALKQTPYGFWNEMNFGPTIKSIPFGYFAEPIVRFIITRLICLDFTTSEGVRMLPVAKDIWKNKKSVVFVKEHKVWGTGVKGKALLARPNLNYSGENIYGRSVQSGIKDALKGYYPSPTDLRRCVQFIGDSNVRRISESQRSPFGFTSVSGASAREVVLWILDGLVENQADWKHLVVIVGTNDLRNPQTPVERCWFFFEYLMSILESYFGNIRLVLTTLPLPRNVDIRMKTIKFNLHLRRMCEERGISLCDFGERMAIEKSWDRLMLKDDIHPNELGYKLWLESLCSMMSQ